MNAKVLIVEDEGIVAKDIQQTLLGLGYKVTGIASNGEDAITKASETCPDIILMDIMLKGNMDGVQAAASIRMIRKIPVIFLTAYSDDDTLQRAKVTEPFGYIVKPYHTRDLYTAIEMGLYKRQMELMLEESRELLRVTLKSLGEGVIATDDQARVSFMNFTAEQITGWTSEAAADQYIGSVIPLMIQENPRDKELTIFDFVKNGPKYHHERKFFTEVQLKTRTGSSIPIDLTLSPIISESGTILGNVCVFRDISERLQRSNEIKSLLVGEQKARAEAEAANRSKDIFLATVSHELKTPLTVILAWAQMFKYRNLDAERIQQGADIIEKNSKAQAVIINDLLDLSRIATGKIFLDVTSQPLSALITQAIDGVRPSATNKKIEIFITGLNETAIVHTDSTRLQQILGNLLTNAVKFTPEGGRIDVAIQDSQDPNHFEIEIKDSGKGIDENFIPHIFESFSQEDSSASRQHGGLGLGLAISKSLIEMLGGKIIASSPGPNLGASFKISIPKYSAKSKVFAS